MTATSASSDAATRLAGVALRLFDEQGYDATTTQMIADEAGVTQRTFFRHFPKKTDVLFADADDATLEFFERLYSRPTSMPVTEALIEMIAEQEQARPVDSNDARRVRIIRSTPSLQDALRAYETSFETALAVWIAQRHRRGADDFDVRVLAATLVAARRVVVEEWERTGGATPVADLARRAMGSIDSNL